MSTAANDLTETLIRAVVGNAYKGDICCDLLSAGSLTVVSSPILSEGHKGTYVENEDYLSVRTVDASGHETSLIWGVSVAEALTFLAKGVTVEF